MSQKCAVFIILICLGISGAGAFKGYKSKSCNIRHQCRENHLSSKLSHTNPSILKMSDNDDLNNLAEGQEFTRKQIIKEEIEAPFRKVRLFIYTALFAAATIGSLITIIKLLAATSGARVEDMGELYTNLGINLGGLPVIGYLYKRDIDQQRSLLERIQKGGKLAGLRMKIATDDGPLIVKLSDFRTDRGIEKRVVIVAASKELLKSSLETSIKESKNLIANDLMIVPLIIDETDGDYTLTATSLEAMIPDTPNIAEYQHLGLAMVLGSWNAVIKKELAVAIKQQPEALAKGVTIIIKKNGKVGTRRFGVPIWEGLVRDVSDRAELGLDVSNI